MGYGFEKVTGQGGQDGALYGQPETYRPSRSQGGGGSDEEYAEVAHLSSYRTAGENMKARLAAHLAEHGVADLDGMSAYDMVCRHNREHRVVTHERAIDETGRVVPAS